MDKGKNSKKQSGLPEGRINGEGRLQRITLKPMAKGVEGQERMKVNKIFFGSEQKKQEDCKRQKKDGDTLRRGRRRERRRSHGR